MVMVCYLTLVRKRTLIDFDVKFTMKEEDVNNLYEVMIAPENVSAAISFFHKAMGSNATRNHKMVQ